MRFLLKDFLKFSVSLVFVFSGSTEEEDKRLGFVAPVLFFILALQTGLSSLDPEERLVLFRVFMFMSPLLCDGTRWNFTGGSGRTYGVCIVLS